MYDHQKPFLLKHWKTIGFIILVTVLVLFFGWRFQWEFSIPGIGKIMPPAGNKNDSTDLKKGDVQTIKDSPSSINTQNQTGGTNTIVNPPITINQIPKPKLKSVEFKSRNATTSNGEFESELTAFITNAFYATSVSMNFPFPFSSSTCSPLVFLRESPYQPSNGNYLSTFICTTKERVGPDTSGFSIRDY